VTGLFKTITLSAWFDNYAYLNLDIARVLIDSETALTRLNLHFKDRADLSVSSAQLNQLLTQHYTNSSQAIEITPWADGAKLFEELTQALQLSSGIIMTILIIMVSASLAFSTMMNIFERTQEVATLGALGASPKKIRSMLVKESLVLAVIAALIGVSIAGIVFAVTLNYGIPIHNAELKGFLGSSHFHPAFEVKGVIAGLLIPFVIAFLASFIFANRSSKLPIANALADH
jgi:putative ABC transport system permease protein